MDQRAAAASSYRLGQLGLREKPTEAGLGPTP